MYTPSPLQSLDLDTMMSFVSTVLAEMNLGLLIYHLEDPEDPLSLRLIYANAKASEYTGSDLAPLTGLTIAEAFPPLAATDLPDIYADVARGGHSRNLGTFEYPGDGRIEHSYYAVRAFPMPAHCVGIVFENITLRKQLEALIRKERQPGSS
ncbi:MAG: hypothetical protein KatS3mg042_0111 [Rhodothermaceae bacterium]|nr:MAG: hypothetical protein KatS3mg042_0111 [Rhodothermaceae bacterium]